jgi:hypothetical protein
MPGLRGTPAVTMITSEIFQHVVAGAALIMGVEIFNRCGFSQIQALALRHAIRDIDKGDIAQFLEASEVCERAPDHACANQSDFIPACH